MVSRNPLLLQLLPLSCAWKPGTEGLDESDPRRTRQVVPNISIKAGARKDNRRTRKLPGEVEAKILMFSGQMDNWMLMADEVR